MELLVTDGEDAFWAPVPKLVPEVDPNEFVILPPLAFFLPFALPSVVRSRYLFQASNTFFHSSFLFLLLLQLM